MSDFDNCSAVLIVFAMDGCPHCEEYQPRFEHEVRRFQQAGVPLKFYNGGVVPRGVIPVIVLDGASEDPQIVGLADQHQVTGMPTTILLLRYGAPIKLEGALEDREIYDLLVTAARA